MAMESKDSWDGKEGKMEYDVRRCSRKTRRANAPTRKARLSLYLKLLQSRMMWDLLVSSYQQFKLLRLLTPSFLSFLCTDLYSQYLQ